METHQVSIEVQEMVVLIIDNTEVRVTQTVSIVPIMDQPIDNIEVILHLIEPIDNQALLQEVIHLVEVMEVDTEVVEVP